MANDKSKPSSEPHHTNNHCSISKLSAIKAGYYNDEGLLKAFIEQHPSLRPAARSSIINRGYAARLIVFDEYVRNTINLNEVQCVIILGAGFDMFPLRNAMSSSISPPETIWIEIDLPVVIQQKVEFCAQKLGTSFGQFPDQFYFDEREIVMFPENGLNFIGCNLESSEELRKKLAKLLDLLANKTGPLKTVAILNEVCLCYLDSEKVEQLLKAIQELLRERSTQMLVYLGFEQVRPQEDTKFSQIMMAHFDAISQPLKHFLNDIQLRTFFQEKLGFAELDILSLSEIFHSAEGYCSDLHRLLADNFLADPFDEFEELDLFLSHYAVTLGKYFFNQQASRLNEPDTLKQNEATPVLARSDSQANENEYKNRLRVRHIDSRISRYGHSSCVLTDTSSKQTVLLGGGFGACNFPTNLGKGDNQNNPKRKRLDEFVTVEFSPQLGPSGHRLSQVRNCIVDVCTDRLHGQVCLVGSQPSDDEPLLFFNGGRQNPARQGRTNVPFLAKLQADNKLTLKHKFSSDFCKWRHKIIQMQSDRIVQIGGLSSSAGEVPVAAIWNLSSSKLGCEPVSDEAIAGPLDRHSFGLDKVDENTLLLFGGLQTSSAGRHFLVEVGAIALWDLRSQRVEKFRAKPETYSANVHFISDKEFVMIGGISNRTNRRYSPENYIHLGDLRMLSKSEKFMRLPNALVDEQRLSDESILINFTSCQFKSSRKIVSLGGGGNYFTFQSRYNTTHVVCKYK